MIKLIIIALFTFCAKTMVVYNASSINQFVFSKTENGSLDYAIYWSNEAKLNDYCDFYYGIQIAFQLDMSDLDGVEAGETEMCFYQVKNTYDALNKTFLISDYLSDKTWPNETGLYITPNSTLTDLSKAGNGYEDQFVFKGNNDSGIINKWCLSGKGFREIYHNQTSNSQTGKTKTFSLTIMMLDVNGSQDNSINCSRTNVSTVSFCTNNSYEEACFNNPPSLTFKDADDDDDDRDWLIWIWITLVAVIVIIVMVVMCKFITFFSKMSTAQNKKIFMGVDREIDVDSDSLLESKGSSTRFSPMVKETDQEIVQKQINQEEDL